MKRVVTLCVAMVVWMGMVRSTQSAPPAYDEYRIVLMAFVDTDGLPGVWDVAGVNVMGEEITLKYIEAKHLGSDFNEPRIHMALVCAAMSCPKLRNHPYEGSRLNEQLDSQARGFLKDPRHFRIDRPQNTVHVSEIFRWYQNDFARGPGPDIIPTVPTDLAGVTLRRFTHPYLGEEDRKFLAQARVEYIPYDWTLNEQPR